MLVVDFVTRITHPNSTETSIRGKKYKQIDQIHILDVKILCKNKAALVGTWGWLVLRGKENKNLSIHETSPQTKKKNRKERNSGVWWWCAKTSNLLSCGTADRFVSSHIVFNKKEKKKNRKRKENEERAPGAVPVRWWRSESILSSLLSTTRVPHSITRPKIGRHRFTTITRLRRQMAQYTHTREYTRVRG